MDTRPGSVTCLAVHPGPGSHTFVEINHEIISMTMILPSADSRRRIGRYKQKDVHKVLVDRLSQACPGKNAGLGELTTPT